MLSSGDLRSGGLLHFFATANPSYDAMLRRRTRDLTVKLGPNQEPDDTSNLERLRGQRI
jgi:hypothetical protein